MGGWVLEREEGTGLSDAAESIGGNWPGVFVFCICINICICIRITEVKVGSKERGDRFV